MVKKMKISLAIAFFIALNSARSLVKLRFLDQRQQYYWLKFQHSSEVCEHLEWLFIWVNTCLYPKCYWNNRVYSLNMRFEA